MARLRTGQWIICSSCYTPFYIGKGRAAKQANHFCTKHCWRDHLRGNDHRNEQSFINVGGYRVVRDTDGNWILENRLVMQEYLGRPLTNDEQIYHLNDDRLDCAIENLSMKALTAYDDLRNSPHRPPKLTPQGMWSYQHDRCTECGTQEISHYARGLCVRCYMKQRFANRKTAN